MSWQVKRLGDVITLQRGFDLPSQDRRPGQVPIVSSSGVSGTHDEARVPAPGVVTGRYGSIGQVHFIESDFWPLNTTLFVKDFRGNDPRFISYLLRTVDFASCSDKSSVPGVNRNDLHRLRVAVPDLPVQLYIAETLGALDNKIELNRRMSRILESIARTIFKSWFVDFDAVRAKAQGRDSGLPPALADLFPHRLVHRKLGEIPEGWSAVPLHGVATFINGATYGAFEPNADGRGLPIVKIAELKAGVTSTTRFSEVQMPEKYRIGPRDILFSWSGNPDTSIDTFVWAHDEAWLNQHIFRVLPQRPHERSFVLTLLRHLRPVFAEIARNKQTTGLGHVTAADMKRLLVVRPDDSVLRAWDAVAAPILELAFVRERENGSLADLRDALLPRLLSGEVRVASVDDAEAPVEVL